MKLVKCSAKVAATRTDDSGSRKVRIFKGTGQERVVEINRHGTKFPDNGLPPEIAADPELIVVDLPSDKPERQEIETTVATDVAALEYPALVEKAKELGIKAHGVKKEHLLAAVIASIADAEKAKLANQKKGDRVQLREATEKETATILAAEGVQPGDVIELESGKYRVVSMNDTVVIEPAEGA